MWAESTSGLSFCCKVALEGLLPQAGSLHLCKALRCPLLSSRWVRAELLTLLSTCCIPLSLTSQGPSCASEVSGEKPAGPSSGSGEEKPCLSCAGCRLLAGLAKPGQTLGGAEVLRIFAALSLAWAFVGFGHPEAFLNAKALGQGPIAPAPGGRRREERAPRLVRELPLVPGGPEG